MFWTIVGAIVVGGIILFLLFGVLDYWMQESERKAEIRERQAIRKAEEERKEREAIRKRREDEHGIR